MKKEGGGRGDFYCNNTETRGGGATSSAHQLSFNNQPIHLSVSPLVTHRIRQRLLCSRLASVWAMCLWPLWETWSFAPPPTLPPCTPLSLSKNKWKKQKQNTNIDLQNITPRVLPKYVQATACWPGTNGPERVFKQTCWCTAGTGSSLSGRGGEREKQLLQLTGKPICCVCVSEIWAPADLKSGNTDLSCLVLYVSEHQ